MKVRALVVFHSSVLFQNSPPPVGSKTASSDTTFETIGSPTGADQSGWDRPCRAVSITVVFEKYVWAGDSVSQNCFCPLHFLPMVDFLSLPVDFSQHNKRRDRHRDVSLDHPGLAERSAALRLPLLPVERPGVSKRSA